MIDVRQLLKTPVDRRTMIVGYIVAGHFEVAVECIQTLKEVLANALSGDRIGQTNWTGKLRSVDMAKSLEQKYDEAFAGWTPDDIRYFGLRALYRTLVDPRLVVLTRPTRRPQKKKKEAPMRHQCRKCNQWKDAAYAVRAAYAAAKAAQVQMIAELGNPFKKERTGK